MNSNRHPEVNLPEGEAQDVMGRHTRRSLIAGGIATAAALGFYRWVTHSDENGTLPSPQRRVLDFNGRLARAYLSNNGSMPTYPPEAVGGVKPNGDIGLAERVSPEDWRVRVEHEEGNLLRTFSIADFKAMPKTDLITRFCCIEGWSGVAHWGGVQFREFTRSLFPDSSKLPKYVYMATPGEEYYVGLDMKSAMHHQTLLAYEQNGKPLEVRRGAPLRLAIPVKYGIKNIKQLSLIRYTDTRPDDYWAEENYDWFAGL